MVPGGPRLVSERPTHNPKRLFREWPVGVFFALTAVFLWKIALTNRILAGLDVFTFFYPYRAYASEAILGGRLPLWNPHLFLGVPFFADSQTGVLYPLNLALAWLPVPSQVSYSIVLHTGLGALFAYIFARGSLKTGKLAALVTGTVFAFGGFLGAQGEHVNQLSVSVWLPLMLYAWDRAALWARVPWKAKLRTAFCPLSALAGIIGMCALAGHAQSLYICATALALYAVWPAIQQRAWRKGTEKVRGLPPPLKGLLAALLGLGAAALLGLAVAGVQLLPTLELAGLSLRGGGLTYREAVSFSLRPRLMLTSLLPQFRAGVFSEYVAYVGIFATGLALVGFWRPLERRKGVVFAVLAALGLLLALGGFNPVYYVLYRLVPGFGLFRAPARWLLLFHFGIAVMSGMGMERLCRQPLRHADWKPLLWSAAGIVLFFAVGSIWMDRPALQTVGIWLGCALLAGLGIWAAARPGERARWARALLTVGLILELFFASRSLAYNRPTAPQAYTSMRSSIAHILADPDAGRMLSLSDLVFDPGDLKEIQAIYQPYLPPDSVYDYVVAAKQKEVLAPNLPMEYGISSLDGYGGGILPLQGYYKLEKLFLPEDHLSPDGRLREGLTEIPDGGLLGAFGVKYIIADKTYDLWHNGVYYDLSLRAALSAGQTVEVPLHLGSGFPADAIGLVSYLDGMETLPDGAEVAEIVVEFTDGSMQRLPILAGRDTSEGRYSPVVAHRRALAVSSPRAQPDITCYLSTFSLPAAQPIRRLHISRTDTGGTLAIRGMSLVNEATGTFWPLTVSTYGTFALVHSGDVKIYENLDARPRLYVVYRATPVRSDEEAISLLLHNSLDPRTSIAVLDGPSLDGDSSLPWQVKRIVDEPERVVSDVHLEAPGYLVLSDTDYPGWHATVDGAPVPILRANGLIRAVYLTPGDHRVDFIFRPTSLTRGLACSGAALALWLAAWMAASRLRRP